MTLKFELTDQEANLVMAALAKQPFEVVAGLIQKIQQQAQPQLADAQKESGGSSAS
jgi:hypothetical protein